MKRFATWPLAPLVPIYAAGVRLKNATYTYGVLKPQRLAWPVISIGNLSVGGTGKTPLVLLLARLLAERGWYVDVLSRGYGRSSRKIARVDSSGTAAEYGDETLMMARRGLPVFVGADRYQPGKLAEESAGIASPANRRLHLLDDGFQHRRLARAVDIVLLQRADLRDDVLPLGRLRETLSALERADICVLRAEDADLTGQVQYLMRQTDPSRIWLADRETVLPQGAERKFLAFCAIGDPAGFFQGLRPAGASPAAELAFRDHHIYTGKDVRLLKARARAVGAEVLITTEKDAVRLSQEMRAEIELDFPLLVAKLEVSLRDAARTMSMLEELLAVRLQESKQDMR